MVLFIVVLISSSQQNEEAVLSLSPEYHRHAPTIMATDHMQPSAIVAKKRVEKPAMAINEEVCP